MNSKAKIIDVATRHFALNGVDGTSLQAIADDVGIKKPSIMYHFANKEALRVAVLDALLARWTEVVPRLVQATSGRGAERFDALAGEVVSFFSEDPNRARLLHRAIIERPEEMRVALRNHVRPWIRLVSEQMSTEAGPSGVQAQCDPPAYIIVFICSVVGTISMNASLDDAAIDPGSSKNTVHRLLRELLRTMRAGLFAYSSDAAITTHAPQETHQNGQLPSR